MQQELISFIIPIYNVEKYLDKCLNSVINQTYKNIEIICVDDGSTDSSADIATKFATDDKRIKVITQENQRAGVARNTGLDISTGEYVTFIDSDDYIHPQLAEIAMHYMHKHDADLVTYRELEIKLEDEDAFNMNILEDISNIDHAVTSTPLYNLYNKNKDHIAYLVCKLYRRETLDGVRYMPDIYYEDVLHTLTVLNKKPKTVVLDKVLYAYISSNSSSITGMPYTIKHLTDRHTTIVHIHEMFKDTDDYDFACSSIVEELTRQQYNNIRGSSVDNKMQLWRTFATQLKELERYGVFRRKDYTAKRYIRYKLLMWLLAEK